MSNFTKLHLTLELFRILPVLSQFLWNLSFIFLRIKITQLPGGFHLKFEVGAKTKGRLNLPRSLCAFENCKRHVKATRWYERLEGIQWTNLFFIESCILKVWGMEGGKSNRSLSRGCHFVSRDLKSFVYVQLASFSEEKSLRQNGLRVTKV